MRAGLAKRCEMPLRRLDHQVDVDAAAALVNQAAERPEHDRADDDRLDEVPIANVVVKEARTRGEQLLDLLSEAREVGRIEGRLDLGLSQPVCPGHCPDPTQPAAERTRPGPARSCRGRRPNEAH